MLHETLKLYPFQKEIWKPIKDYEGLYEVSNLGRVRSVERTIVDSKCVRVFHEKTLKPTKHSGKQPYCYVSLSKNRKVRKRMVHRLVAETFIANPLNKEQVNHKDGNVLNNCVENLEWCTNAENTQHAYDTWLNKKGQLHIEYKGVMHSLRKWCDLLNINYKRAYYRIKHCNWSFEKMINYEFGGNENHVRN